DGAGPDSEPDLAGFGGLPDWSAEHLLAAAARAAKQHPADLGEGKDAGAEELENSDGDDQTDDGALQPYLGASTERLASKDFAELTDAERIAVGALRRRPALALPGRRSRRQRRRPGGRRTDMRATVRLARRTGGHAFRLIGRNPARRPRRLVVLCDISGSMEPYARSRLQLLHSPAPLPTPYLFTLPPP